MPFVAAVTAFRVYHVRAGTMAGEIEHQLQMEPGRRYKPFLHHITKGRPIQVRIVKIKTHPALPRTLTDNDMKRVVAACTHLRDEFLIRLLAGSKLFVARVTGRSEHGRQARAIELADIGAVGCTYITPRSIASSKYKPRSKRSS